MSSGATRRFPAAAGELVRVRGWLRRELAAMGIDEALAGELVLAVNEACMNVIQHAYGGEPAGEMQLQILNNADEVQFLLSDRAAPVDLDAIRPRPLGELRPSGLGTHFIAAIMDHTEYGHLPDGAGNYLRMTRRLQPRERRPAGADTNQGEGSR